MFSGIVQTIGKITQAEPRGGGLQMTIAPKRLWREKIRIGESIAVSGVCLTVVKTLRNSFTVELIAETLAATTFAQASVGDWVNLERSLRLSDYVGGHFVFGHVDGTGRILKKLKRGDDYVLRIATPRSIKPCLAPKGSIAVDGISLTIQKIYPNAFQVAIIPHTASVTTLVAKGAGSNVNIEADMMAKQIYQYLNQFRIRS
ncbi:MAG: riboflavin synthase [Candidatus Omnitrophica bacterium]|nr:riboflavin synthase [Candidatus Omnitrophota bacterium]